MNNLKNSQNFLVNRKLVSDLVGISSINSEDLVIEIGPGKGIITKCLLEKANKVIAIELDLNLYDELKKAIPDDKVEFILGDFLRYDLPTNDSYKIFANIPFQITSQIISKITEHNNKPIDSYLILQKEAAMKYMGIPYQQSESLRSLLLKPHFDITVEHQFKRNDFKPVPSVDIVMIRMSSKHSELRNEEYAVYQDFLAYLYDSPKNVTMKKALADLFSYTQIKRLSKDNGFKLDDNYTVIDYSQWINIFRYFLIGVSDEKKQIISGRYNKLKTQQSRLKKQHRSRKRR